MKKIPQNLKLLGIWTKRNANAIIAVCGVAALIFSIYTYVQKNKVNEETYTSNVQKNKVNEETYAPKRPNLKIKSVYLKTIPYQAIDGSSSVALKFFIPIRNEGDATAYNIEIKNKELDLVRGDYDLSEPSLMSVYTNSPFNLEPGEAIEDTIFIDETPAHVQQIFKGDESISLKYEIWFYANKKSKKDPFVYKEKVIFTKGQFKYDSAYESVHRKIKP